MQQMYTSILLILRHASCPCIGIGAAVIIIGYVQTATWQTAAYGQCRRIRVKLLRAILRQEIGWFDVHEIGELNTRISESVDSLISITSLFLVCIITKQVT